MTDNNEPQLLKDIRQMSLDIRSLAEISAVYAKMLNNLFDDNACAFCYKKSLDILKKYKEM